MSLPVLPSPPGAAGRGRAGAVSRPPVLPMAVPPALRRPLRWPRTWPEAALTVFGLSLAGAGAAPLLGHPGLSWPLAWCGVAMTLGTAGLGARAARHTQLVDDVLEALAPRVGFQCRVRAYGWRGGLIGAPSRVTIHYAAGAVDDDPSWIGDILDTVQRRLQHPYRLISHHQRRRRLRLAAVRSSTGRAPDLPPLQQRAERILAEVIGPGCAITPSWSGDELVSLHVQHASVKVASSGLHRHRVERTFSTLMPGRWRARWDLEQDQVVLEQRPPLPLQAPRLPQPLTESNRWQIPLAVDEDGRDVVWDLGRSTGPHLLVVGKTGLGKTVLIRGVVVEVARRGWPVRIVDPKMIEFLGLETWPNVEIVATDLLGQIAVILDTWREQESRYARIRAGQLDERDLEPIVLILDEVRELYAAISEWWASVRPTGAPSRCPVLDKIASMVRKGRSARVHLVIGTQRPDAEWLGGDTRDSLATRYSAGPLSPQGALMMWESSTVGVAVPRNIPGRGTAYLATGEPGEVQALWTPDPRRALRDENLADQAALDALAPEQVLHPSLQVVLDEELLTRVDAKGRPQEWAAVSAAVLVPLEDDEPLEDDDQLEDDEPLKEPAYDRPVGSASSPVSADELAGDAAPQVVRAKARPAPPRRAGRSTNAPSRRTATGAAARAENGTEATATVLQLRPRRPAGRPSAAWDERDVQPAAGHATATGEPEDDLGDASEGLPSSDAGRDELWESEVCSVAASQLQAGDLVAVDDDNWMIVEDAAPDIEADDYVCIDLRGDNDERDSLSVPADEPMAVRRPREEPDQDTRPTRFTGR